jgi:hypothetical protein
MLLYTLTAFSGCKMLASVATARLNLYSERDLKNRKAQNEAKAQCKIFPVQ